MLDMTIWPAKSGETMGSMRSEPAAAQFRSSECPSTCPSRDQFSALVTAPDGNIVGPT